LFDVMSLCFRRETATRSANAAERMLAHDRLADRFDELMNERRDAARRRPRQRVSRGGRSPRPTGLDAGCGTGRATAALAGRGADVVAIDLGERLVARTRLRCACRPLVGSVMVLPFPDATFDVVLSTEVIEHVPDPALAVKEFARVLKPGGHLVLSTPNRFWQGPVRLASAIGLRPYDRSRIS
jgi:2-polyprenyl-3-methyl-5-hydroxy-6-metoxy-1,4-benzoquinol methylase